jgi:LmbE family N-acetylglucosaminyl deacetylase
MFLTRKIKRVVLAGAMAAVLVLAGFAAAGAQQSPAAGLPPAAGLALPAAEASDIALPLPEDRGQAALEQTVKRLGTTASVLYIVAHPDDEDGALLTYLSRGLGARVTLLTLTRGEGGQNAISAETYDALGLMRTNELEKADEYYGVRELWGTEADFGFSKTQQESFARWSHERVLYDAVLAVRQVRPQVIVATFVGGVSDGHGQHQVSGEIAQEVFKAAADPKVFPEQLKDGLEAWQPLAMYSRIPFAPLTNRGIFDYATGKWAPARFHNYITGEWTTAALSTDVSIPVGTWDPVLGLSYVQIARQGWGEQKSQNGGANPVLSGPASSGYHLWAVAPEAAAPNGTSHESASPDSTSRDSTKNNSLFSNDKVQIDTSLKGLTGLVKGKVPEWLVAALGRMDDGLKQYESDCRNETGVEGAHKLAPIYRQALELYAQVKASDLDAESKAGLELELGVKVEQFQAAFDDLLGLDLSAVTSRDGEDETARSVTPGEEFRVRVHATRALGKAQLTRVWLESQSGSPWKAEDIGGAMDPEDDVNDRLFRVTAAGDAQPTAPFFTRPNIEQPYYDISNEKWRDRSFAPWPLAAWAQFSFDGLPIRLGQVVQTLARVTGQGGVYQPLVVTPAIGVRIDPEARILPLDGAPLPVKVTVHAEAAAEGTVTLQLPDGWKAEPAERQFQLKSAGDTEPLLFSVSTDGATAGIYSVKAVARSGGRAYQTGWRSVGYQGLRPYNQYLPAELKTRKVDVKLAPGLRVGYIMGPGDLVPEAIEELGAPVHLLNAAELAAGDYSAWNVLVIGIRAYSTRPDIAAAQPRLDEFVRRGGTLIVEYQSATFPAPLPLAMGRMPERVVDEQAPVKLLDAANPLLSWPNKITTADFDGWIEERGHSFLDSWDPGYTALTETADEGQDPQRGGLLVTHPGKGTYIYLAYALYRQLPELVPGSYRLLANLLSAGRGGN